MKRNDFLKTAAWASAGCLLSAKALSAHTSFRLFDKKSTGKVIFCVLGGGIRTADIWNSEQETPMPFLTQCDNLSNPATGTVLKQFGYKNGPIEHYSAMAALLSGRYEVNALSPLNTPSHPTVLNHINFFQHKIISGIAHPLTAYHNLGYPAIHNPTHQTNNSPSCLDLLTPAQVWNQQSVALALHQLIHQSADLIVIELQGADIAHSNFGAYLQHLTHLDQCIKNLWNGIKSSQDISSQTTLIVTPDIGRNEMHNDITDREGRGGLDHHRVEARETFCWIAGPETRIRKGKMVDSTYGESIDILPTISHLLGVRPTNGDALPGKILTEALLA